MRTRLLLNVLRIHFLVFLEETGSQMCQALNCVYERPSLEVPLRGYLLKHLVATYTISIT